jgi:hypothetical protein
MNYKLNILEPWESGTESAIDISVVKETEGEFLLFLHIPIKTEYGIAQYFVTRFKNEKDKTDFKKNVPGIYPVQMVFDKNITNENCNVPNLSSYRSNFLSGEIVI